MLSILEEEGFVVTMEEVIDNYVEKQLERGSDVIILRQTFHPPDEIENEIYIRRVRYRFRNKIRRFRLWNNSLRE